MSASNMSASPPASNPDRRPLPDGWITRYDENYRAWYYVDTRAQPPRSSWDHPHGAPPPVTSPPSNYQTPSNNPPNRYAGSPPYNQPQGQSYPPQPSFNQVPSYSGSAYQGTQPDPRGYQQPGFQPQPNYGGAPPGNYGNPEWQQPGFQQPQPQGYPAQPPPQATAQTARGSSGRSNVGTGLLAGGAGLLGGVVLAEGFQHHEHERHERHERRERREDEAAYDQGYIQGEQNAEFGGNW